MVFVRYILVNSSARAQHDTALVVDAASGRHVLARLISCDGDISALQQKVTAIEKLRTLKSPHILKVNQTALLHDRTVQHHAAYSVIIVSSKQQ
jgi:hypothetical protein